MNFNIMYSTTTRNSKLTEKERIEWLRSQLIGDDIEFNTYFGKRKLTHADHTASGRSVQYIEDYIKEQVLPVRIWNTHTNDSFVGIKTTQKVSEATDYIKRCVGAGPDDAVIFCGSSATASIKRIQEIIGISAPSTLKDSILKNLKDEERWVVFVGPYEHHSDLLLWNQSLAEVVEIGTDENGLIDMKQLTVELRSLEHANRPMMGSFSACCHVTGVISDTRAIARLLHQHGAFACFNFSSSGPHIEFDMKSGDIEGYDAIFLSPHKFVGGLGSPGILLVNKSLYRLKDSPPSTCGGGTVSYVNGFNDQDTLYIEDVEEREDAGTPAIIQKIRTALAFWVKEYIGYDLINLYESVYIDAALQRLLLNPNIAIIGNLDVKRLPILSFLVYPVESSCDSIDIEFSAESKQGKPLNGRFVAKLLNDLFGIQARGGYACTEPYGQDLLGIDQTLSLCIQSPVKKGYNGLKPEWTGISFSYYMSKDEFLFILDCIEFIAAYGHRFLHLYQFDWVTGEWTFKKHATKNRHIEEELILSSSNSLAKRERSSKISGSGNRFTSYLESAYRIALSLSDCRQITSAPEDI